MTKRKSKTKAPKVERWVVVDANGVGIATETTRDAAERWTSDRHGSPRWGHKVVRLIPANPHADAVVKAAREWKHATTTQAKVDWARQLSLLVEALERSE